MHIRKQIFAVVFVAPALVGIGYIAAANDKATAVAVQPNPASPTAGIQEAIDAISPTGGVVTLTAGEYLLRQSIRVRTNLTIQGAGPETVLRKGKQAGSKLVAAAGGAVLPGEVNALWKIIPSEIPALGTMTFANFPETGLLLDAAPWAALPFVEGETLHYKPTKA